MRRLGLFSTTFLSLLTSLSAFDFTPRILERTNVEGNGFTVYYFNNKGTLYRPHLFQAALSGTSEEARFSFKELNQASMRLRSHPLIYRMGHLSADDKESLLEAAKPFAPDGATLVSFEVKPCSELENRDVPAGEVTALYDLPGHRIWQSVIFFDLVPKEPMVMISTAYEKDAEETRSLALRSLFGWVETTMDELEKPPMH